MRRGIRNPSKNHTRICEVGAETFQTIARTMSTALATFKSSLSKLTAASARASANHATSCVATLLPSVSDIEQAKPNARVNRGFHVGPKTLPSRVSDSLTHRELQNFVERAVHAAVEGWTVPCRREAKMKTAL